MKLQRHIKTYIKREVVVIKFRIRTKLLFYQNFATFFQTPLTWGGAM